jgi:periplasmic divalent cation tolerance protein
VTAEAGLHATEFVSVYMTAGSLEEGTALGRVLVTERLAACVNVLPGAVSIYAWEGELHEDDEVVLLAKTRRSLVEPLSARVATVHGYDLPAILVLPIVGGSPAYLTWLAEQTRPA